MRIRCHFAVSEFGKRKPHIALKEKWLTQFEALLLTGACCFCGHSCRVTILKLGVAWVYAPFSGKPGNAVSPKAARLYRHCLCNGHFSRLKVLKCVGNWGPGYGCKTLFDQLSKCCAGVLPGVSRLPGARRTFCAGKSSRNAAAVPHLHAFF
ncbi:hypothetical protein TcCL_ESM06213 [Trypanosoma cruzi]|nr:hypothetical protein TcCL_ESM06213 [Trypanosoma cruzi]